MRQGIVGGQGIEPSASFLFRVPEKFKYHMSDISRKMIVWVRIESNYGPLSYQESVLPLNYAPSSFFVNAGKRSTDELVTLQISAERREAFYQ